MYGARRCHNVAPEHTVVAGLVMVRKIRIKVRVEHLQRTAQGMALNH